LLLRDADLQRSPPFEASALTENDMEQLVASLPRGSAHALLQKLLSNLVKDPPFQEKFRTIRHSFIDECLP
jgi:hypothetical protein